MLAEERWQIILNLIGTQNVVSVMELSKRLSASEVTIRRDLRELEEMGRLKRTHGGAVRLDYAGTSFEPHFSELENENVELKEKIGRRASGLITDKSAILLDASSSAAHLCRHIPELPLTSLMVVTNSVRVVAELSNCDFVELVMIGGQIRKNLQSSSGLLADMILRELKVDKAFIGINGIDLADNVMTTPNLTESAIKRSMMRCAGETIFLADHTKFDRSYLSRVCSVTDADLILTDDGVNEQIVKQAEELGVDMMLAGDGAQGV